MRLAKYGLMVLTLSTGVAWGSEAASPVPAPNPPVTTFWNFLGIPQGINKIRDATVNSRGNRPGMERKPALKRIADPANLQSPNPAIRVAAQAKMEEDMAPQKIKALKYLGSIGCACPQNKPDVKNALLAALDDCTEAVRYEAAVAICRAAGSRCNVCNQGSCCAPDVMAKLEQMARGKDANGCCLEPSPRVREAASLALEACQLVSPSAPAPMPTPAPMREMRGDSGPGAETDENKVTAAENASGEVVIEDSETVPVAWASEASESENAGASGKLRMPTGLGTETKRSIIVPVHAVE